MPVGEKIYSLGYDVDINSGFRRINIGRNDNGLMKKAPEYYEEFRGNKSYNSNLSTMECVYRLHQMV